MATQPKYRLATYRFPKKWWTGHLYFVETEALVFETEDEARAYLEDWTDDELEGVLIEPFEADATVHCATCYAELKTATPPPPGTRVFCSRQCEDLQPKIDLEAWEEASPTYQEIER